jgi:predicted  nucleic acid-binding Zn-ribbon protein
VYVQPGYYAAPGIAELRASAQKQNRRAQELELELRTLRQQNAQLHRQLNAVLLQVKQIKDQVAAASAKRGNATNSPPVSATALVSEAAPQTGSARP